MSDHRAKREKAGLPPDWWGAGRLAFDGATSTLILSCTARSLGPSRPLVFVRRTHSPRYTSVNDLFVRADACQAPGEGLCVTSWVLGKHSHLFCAFGRLNPPSAERPVGPVAPVDAALIDVAALYGARRTANPALNTMNAVGLVRVDLRDLSVQSWLAPEVSGRQLLIVSLVGSSDTDDRVYAVVGFPGPRGSGRPSVRPYLTSMDWGRRAIRKVRIMPSVWF